ncbi:MAG: energy transducer TonB [Pseudomonadota bacterium]
MRVAPILAAAAIAGALASPIPAAQAGDKVYTLSELDVVRKVVPDYPRRARAGGFDGWVEVQFTVTPDGGVSEAEVVDSSSRIFHRDALVALQGWRFEPVEQAPVRAQLRFTFRR